MYLLVSVIVFGLFVSKGDGQSPCPGIFEYQNDGLGIHGLIRVQPSGPVSSITTKVNFTIGARLPSTYVGQLKPLNEDQALQSFNSGGPLIYRVHFPVTSPLPKLTSLVVNNREICYGPGDFPAPGQYISTISLQHMLFLRDGATNNLIYPYEQTGNYDKPIQQINYDKPFQQVNYDKPIQQVAYDKPVQQVTYDKPFQQVNFDKPVQQVTYDKPFQPVNFDKPNQEVAYDKPNQQVTYDKPLQQVIYNKPAGVFSGPITITGLPNNNAAPPSQTYTLQGSNGASYTLVLNKTQSVSQGSQNYNVILVKQTTVPPFIPAQTPSAQYYPGFTENPNRFEGQQPPPDYNPYETERPPQRVPPRQPPRPQTPPPNYNPYETSTTQRNQFNQPQPSKPQAPSDSSSPNFNNHGECGVIFGENEIPLIYNGQAYQRGDWPWVVALFKQRGTTLSFICAGTLISHKHVVTAAHCMQQKNSLTASQDLVVKVGVYNVKDWGDDITQTRTLASAVIHERYNSSTLANDILVLTLDRPVEFNNNIRAACLWTGKTDQNRIVGSSGVVAGWGNSELALAGQGDPRMVRIPIVSTAACRSSRPEYHKLTSDSTFCAGDRNGAGPCVGDSGGGLYIKESGRWRLRGVVSLSLRPENGDDTCNLKNYIVFTDAAKYDKWIRDIVQSSLF